MAQTTIADPRKNTPRRRRTWIILATVLVILGVAAAGLVRNAPGQSDALAAVQNLSGSVVTAKMGDIASSVSASGNVQAQRAVQLSLRVAGTIDQVTVEVGDSIKAGDVLVRLDDRDLAREVAVAEQNLVIQQANLAEQEDSASVEELASAQAALDSARAALADVKDGPDAAEITAARANLAAKQEAYGALQAGPDTNDLTQAQATLKNAEAALSRAQAAYDKVAGNPDVGMSPQALDLQQATNNYASALAVYNAATEGASAENLQQAAANVEQARSTLRTLLDSPTPSQLASAEAQVKQAEATLANLQDGTPFERIAVAKAQVQQARLNLESAQAQVDKTTLRAPFDGIVTAVHVAEGETASGRAVDITDPSSLHAVLSVDETDVGKLSAGQPVVIALGTWPGERLAGQISRIAPKATENNSAVVVYEVDVALAPTDLAVREGMTVDAELITASRQNVLLVPTQAITSDRTAGKHYVNVAHTGTGGETVTRVEVTLGIKDDDNTEITGGLQDGDRVVIGEISSAVTTPRSSFIPAPPGGSNRGNPFAR